MLGKRFSRHELNYETNPRSILFSTADVNGEDGNPTGFPDQAVLKQEEPRPPFFTDALSGTRVGSGGRRHVCD